MNANPRPHCTCVEVRNFSVETAAERLGCGIRRLTTELRAEKIPHQRIGGKRVLCMCELRIAMRVFTVMAVVSAPREDTSSATADRLRTIRPAKERRTRTA